MPFSIKEIGRNSSIIFCSPGGGLDARLRRHDNPGEKATFKHTHLWQPAVPLGISGESDSLEI
jgi:hypothetical protein